MKNQKKNEKTTKKDRKRVSATKSSFDKGGVEAIDNLFAAKKKNGKSKEAEEPSRSGAKRHLGDAGRGLSKKSRANNFNSTASTTKNTTTSIGRGWTDDGLGGKYNEEGYTGRVEEGMKIFKAHILNKPNFGNTSACPFDCDCCFI